MATGNLNLPFPATPIPKRRLPKTGTDGQPLCQAAINLFPTLRACECSHRIALEMATDLTFYLTQKGLSEPEAKYELALLWKNSRSRWADAYLKGWVN